MRATGCENGLPCLPDFTKPSPPAPLPEGEGSSLQKSSKRTDGGRAVPQSVQVLQARVRNQGIGELQALKTYQSCGVQQTVVAQVTLAEIQRFNSSHGHRVQPLTLRGPTRSQQHLHDRGGLR